MNKIFLYLSFTLFISLASYAQNQPPQQAKTPEERAERETQRLNQNLTLTEDQKTKIKSIILKNEQQAEQIRTKYASATDKSGMHQEMKQLREAKDAEVKAALTDEQKQKYESFPKEGGNRNGGGYGGPGHDHQGGNHNGHQH